MWLLFQCAVMIAVGWTGTYYEWTPNKVALGIVMVGATLAGLTGIFKRRYLRNNQAAICISFLPPLVLVGVFGHASR